MNQKKPFFHRPHHVSAVAIVIALLIGIFGYMRIHKGVEHAYAVAGPGTISQSDGSVSVRDLTLGFVSGGRISSVNVKQGDTVKKGQVLASLDAGNVAGMLSQARAAYVS